MPGAVSRFLGDSPLRVLLKLLVVSFIVGLVMVTFGWTPYDIIEGIREFFIGIWRMGFAAFGRFFEYILVGAVIVIPAFIVLRLLSYRR